MGRRRKSRDLRCRACGIAAAVTDDETFYGGRCESCRAVAAERRRKAAGERLLQAAKTSRIELRDGHEYSVVVLPPKRPRRRR
jgi:hypothetical protein